MGGCGVHMASQLQGVHRGWDELWTRHGHELLLGAILLGMNRKASSSKRTKHIKVKNNFVKQNKDLKEITIEHCPTEQMWMDINTKPRQGGVFCEFKGNVLGILTDSNDNNYKATIPFTPAKLMLPMIKA